MNDDRILDAEILAAIAANMGLQPVRDIVASHEALRARLADTPELWSCPDCAFTYDAIHVDDATGEHVCPVCREIELERRLADTEAERDAAWADVSALAPYMAALDAAEARAERAEAARDALIAWVGQIGYPYDFTTIPPLPEQFIRPLAEWWWRDSGESGTVDEWADGIADEAQIAARAALGEQEGGER